MEILHLTLHRKWFDLIAAGSKVVEYRQDNDYWHKRIFGDSSFSKKFDEIHFRNGYGSHRPLMVAEFLFAFVTHSNLCSRDHGEELDGQVIVIAIGNKIRFENYTKLRSCAGCGENIAHDESLCDKCSGQLLAAKCVWGKRS